MGAYVIEIYTYIECKNERDYSTNDLRRRFGTATALSVA